MKGVSQSPKRRHQRVEEVEPYEVDVCKWVTENKQVRLPKNSCQESQLFSSSESCLRQNGCAFRLMCLETLLESQPLCLRHQAFPPNRVAADPISERLSTIPIRELARSSTLQSERQSKTIVGRPTVRKLSDTEFAEFRKSLKPNSVLVPESKSQDAETELTTVKPRTETASESPQTDGEAEPADSVPDLSENDPIPRLEPEATIEVETTDQSDIQTRPDSDDGS